MSTRAKDRPQNGWLFLSPALIHFALFAVAPILYAVATSFYKFRLLRPQIPFVGIQNYAHLAHDQGFWNAMANSIRYTLFSVPIGAAVALGVALLVSQPLRSASIFRTIYYLPSIVSSVAISMMWLYIFLPEKGFINTVLGSLGFSTKTDFLNDTSWAMPALIFMSVWIGLGPRMMLFLSGILAIPKSLYEAAELDGCTSGRAFWRITLPLLSGTTFFVLITSTISALQVFTPVYMMTKGGPMDTTDVVGFHIYKEAWWNLNIGLASAQSVVLFILTAAFSLVQYRLMRKNENLVEVGA